ncbi:MAG TPA: hypothetical protein VJ957_03895 [Longimicrobiales bacterium]|nr:hypothetical protein [Longimicrobiales bacterium]
MSDRAGCYNIWVMNTDGTGPAQLTGAPGERCSEAPRWSPDGSRIAFHTSRESIDRSWEVYVMNADGTGLVNLTDGTANDWDAVWLPAT